MTVATTAPIDKSGKLIQVLRLHAALAHQITISGTTVRNGTAFDSDTRVVEVFASVDCFIEQGTGSVTATTSNHFLKAEHGKLLSLGGDKQAQFTHIAVIQDSAGGTLYISEME